MSKEDHMKKVWTQSIKHFSFVVTCIYQILVTFLHPISIQKYVHISVLKCDFNNFQCNLENERCAELREVWSGSSNGDSIEMGSEWVEEVRAAMANFALPLSAVPDWASAVPEEQWKQQLLDRIQRLQQQQGNRQPKTWVSMAFHMFSQFHCMQCSWYIFCLYYASCCPG